MPKLEDIKQLFSKKVFFSKSLDTWITVEGLEDELHTSVKVLIEKKQDDFKVDTYYRVSKEEKVNLVAKLNYLNSDHSPDSIIFPIQETTPEMSVGDAKLMDSLLTILLRDQETKKILRKDMDYRGAVLFGMTESHGRLWLAPPSWDCGHYWGFGYLQNRDNHTHFSSFVGGDITAYDDEKRAWVKLRHIHNVYANPNLVECTFSEKEGWMLAELFSQFYNLKKMAEFSNRKRPNSHITDSPVYHGDMTDVAKHINDVMLPKIMDRIMLMLTPDAEIPEDDGIEYKVCLEVQEVHNVKEDEDGRESDTVSN